MTYVEKQELKIEVCKCFELLIDTVERLAKLSSEVEAGTKSEATAKLFGKFYLIGLAGVQKKLNGLLEDAYAITLKEPEFIDELKEATDKVIKGKEHVLVVALMLGEEL